MSRSKSWTLYKLVFLPKNTIICLVLEVATLVWLLPQASSRTTTWHQSSLKSLKSLMTMTSPTSGPQNPVEVQSYRDKLDAIMETFTNLLANDRKDALRSTVTSLKKLMVKHWHQMAKADIAGSTEVHP